MRPSPTAPLATRSPLSRYWLGTALALFAVAALLGALLRLLYLREVPGLDYKHVLHAHSHLALLGWGFTAVSGGVLWLLPNASGRLRRYRGVLLLNAVAGIGMGISFLYQGYGPISISFCTLHLAAAYWFAGLMLSDLRAQPVGMVTRLARWSVYWMVVSTLGLLAVGPISAMLGKLHPLYYASIQFFLHFQFNGWFTYAVLALLIGHFSRRGYAIELRPGIFWLLQASLVLTYALSITWSTPKDLLFYLNSAGVLLQALVFGILLRALYRAHRATAERDPATVLLEAGLLSLALKVAAQTAVAIPAIAAVSYTIRNLVVGFIHLTMLGFVSLTLLGLFVRAGYLPADRRARLGYGLLLVAFVATEALLLGQGLLLWLQAGFIPGYHSLIFWINALFPLALLLIGWSYRNTYFSSTAAGRPKELRPYRDHLSKN